MTMTKVFTPLIRDGIDPERKQILLEDFLSWLIDRAEDNLAVARNGKASPKTDDISRAQDIILTTVEQFLNDRTALGLPS